MEEKELICEHCKGFKSFVRDQINKEIVMTLCLNPYCRRDSFLELITLKRESFIDKFKEKKIIKMKKEMEKDYYEQATNSNNRKV